MLVIQCRVAPQCSIALGFELVLARDEGHHRQVSVVHAIFLSHALEPYVVKMDLCNAVERRLNSSRDAE